LHLLPVTNTQQTYFLPQVQDPLLNTEKLWKILTTDLDQLMWCMCKGLWGISHNIQKWQVAVFPLHVMLEMIRPRKRAQTDVALVSTRIMVEVVILHVYHDFTANFTLSCSSWGEFHEQCLIIDNFVRYHRHCISCKKTDKSAITTSTFHYRNLIHGIIYVQQINP